MTTTRVLHVIQALSRGGAARGMITAARHSAQLAPFAHEVVSLCACDPGATALARAAGMGVLEQPSREDLCRAVAGADIVHVHFWNTPELYAFLRMAKPAARILVWIHVAGDSAPQVVTDDLFHVADWVLASSPYTAELPVFARQAAAGQAPHSMVWLTADCSRLAEIQPRPHAGFNVGYIGAVDFVKMHPEFVAMCTTVAVPSARFLVCGGGQDLPILRRQIEQAGAQERFDLRGYVEEIGPVLEILDVFGYPLCVETYACAELVLQEAMYAGVPPVIFAHGGAQRMVRDGETGLIVHTPAEYTAAIAYLYRNEAERKRLGRNARAVARREFAPHAAAGALNATYQHLLCAPKRQHHWPEPPFQAGETMGAGLFIQSLGQAAQHFWASMHALDTEEQLQAELAIRRAPPVLVSAGAGGILHYRRSYPADRFLRLWAGLVLHQLGRPALATAEFARAAELGLDHWRVYWYQALAAAEAGAPELALAALRRVLDAAPEFAPAQAFANRLHPAASGPKLEPKHVLD